MADDSILSKMGNIAQGFAKSLGGANAQASDADEASPAPAQQAACPHCGKDPYQAAGETIAAKTQSGPGAALKAGMDKAFK